ncbi:hypothetical protein AVEN_15823-1, partial [Araneus ventricosus]
YSRIDKAVPEGVREADVKFLSHSSLHFQQKKHQPARVEQELKATKYFVHYKNRVGFGDIIIEFLLMLSEDRIEEDLSIYPQEISSSALQCSGHCRSREEQAQSMDTKEQKWRYLVV